MRTRLVAVAILFLLAVQSAEAGPKKVFKAVANHVTLGIVTGASSGFNWYGGTVCRRNNGVEPCTAHYGDFKATQVANIVFTGGMIALGEWGRRAPKFKEWWLPETLTLAGNTWWGVHEMRIHKKDTGR